MKSNGCTTAYISMLTTNKVGVNIACITRYRALLSDIGLSFILRTYVDNEDGESVEKVAYTPLHVENDSQELLERLDFLREEFTFTRQQLDIFMNKLYFAMSEDDD